jgi:phosphate transport system substrate-binding protein
MKYSKGTLVKFWAVLLTLAAAPEPLVTLMAEPAIAQTATQTLAQATSPSPEFPLPESLPEGTTVRVDGSASMEVPNQALQQRFQDRFSGTTVNLAAAGTDPALTALQQDEIDLAAVGRPLTEAETAEGLVYVPIEREKIAVIVGPDNPFNGSLTFEQFAQMFRGEITDWSEVGGPAGPIRFVDRPDSSDTRLAFSNYEVFRTAPFETGDNAVQVADDQTATVIGELGQDGIGYAIADQVLDQPNVKIVPMHQTLPDDPRYPFSQPRGYAHKAGAAAPVLAFLGLATTAPGEEIVAAVSPSPTPAVTTTPSPTPVAEATPSPVASPTDTAQAVGTAEREGGFPWWLLLLPLLGIPLLLWLLGRGRDAAPVPAAVPAAAPVVVPPPPVRRSRIILTPRNCREAYAYWEVPEEHLNDIKRQGGRKLALRLYDVTDIDMAHQTPHSVKQFDCNASEQDLHVPIAVDNRDYIAELGYVGEDDRWLPITRSEHVRVPACEPIRPVAETTSVVRGAAIATGAVGAVAVGAAAIRPVPPAVETPSRVILTPRDCRHAYAYWEVLQSTKDALKGQGGQKLMLRLYDVTGLENIDNQVPHDVKQFDCNEAEQDLHIPIALDDRDYIVELGYVTTEGRWLRLARSPRVRVPACPPEFVVARAAGSTVEPGIYTPTVTPPTVIPATAVPPTVTPPATPPIYPPASPEMRVDRGANLGAGILAGGAAIAAGAATAVQGLRRDQSPTETPAPVAPMTTAPRESRVILTTRTPQDLYVYWEVSEAQRTRLKNQGGRKFQLRLYDATQIDLDRQPAHSLREFDCGELSQDLHIPIELSNRDYVAEIGYLTDDNRWLSLARSMHIHAPTVDAGSPDMRPTARSIPADTAPAGSPFNNIVTGAVTAAGAALAGGAAAASQLLPTQPTTASAATASERCHIQRLVVHSKNHCFELDTEQMRRIQQEVAVSQALETGNYFIRIKEGAFGYRGAIGTQAEPYVILWIYGGKVINTQTGIPVMSTWCSLNGYDDALTLQVLEPATLCALFFDTYVNDNNGEVTVSVVKLPVRP